jgi:hypothetical protein
MKTELNYGTILLKKLIGALFNYQTVITKQKTEYQDLQIEDKWHDVTRRETMEAAETAIDKTVEHYKKKVEFINGPKVVKTFK